MAFHDLYTVKSGDNLSNIARSRGYSNPGPIVAYPLNQRSFPPGCNLNLIRPGLRLYIPWHPDLLRKIIATSEHLIQRTSDVADRLIKEQVRNKKELEDFLILIDGINFLTNVNREAISLAIEGIRGAEMSSSEALRWLVGSRATIAREITTMVVPSPTVPKTDFTFFVRHLLGPWTPSFWASVYTAIKERDLDIYLYGSDAIAYKASLKIKQQADHDIECLRAKIGEALNQLAMPFYKHRI